MSSGKCAAQAAHSETLAAHEFHGKFNFAHELDPEVKGWLMRQEELYDIWYGDGHYAKYVMKASDSIQMFTIMHYLESRHFKCYLVVDEGHTEDTYLVPTAMAVELVDKDDERTASIFNTFRMYKDKPKPPEDRSSRLERIRKDLGRRRRAA